MVLSPRRDQRPESGGTDPFTGFSDILEKMATEGSRKLLSCTTGPYVIRSTAESTVPLHKDGVAILVSPSRVTKMPLLLMGAVHPAELHNDNGQAGLSMQRVGEKSNPSVADPNDPKPAD